MFLYTCENELTTGGLKNLTNKTQISEMKFKSQAISDVTWLIALRGNLSYS